MAEELKACRNCGYQGALSGTDHGVYYSLSCPKCRREVTAFTIQGLGEAWNRPTPEQLPADQVAAGDA